MFAPPTLPPHTSLCPISPSTGRIWLDNLSCRGTEQSVTECTSRGWGNSDCTHDEDAGVICKDQRLPGFSDSNVIEVCSTHTHTSQIGQTGRAVGCCMWFEELLEGRGFHMRHGVIWVVRKLRAGVGGGKW